MKNRIMSVITCILVVLISFNLLATTTTPQPLITSATIRYISTENSDCILISDNGHYALVDSPGNDDKQFLVSYLTNLGVKQLDYLILTHLDEDQYGGLETVVKKFAIKNIFVGNGNTGTKTYKDFITLYLNKNLQPSVPLVGRTFTLGNGAFQFFNQTAQYDDINDNRLVVLYTIRNNKFLFMGSLDKEIEESLPLDQIGTVDVLKVGNHGSKTSSSDDFIKAVAPKYGVICCGKNNKYGCPNQETLDTLSRNNISTYRTDLNGTVVATSDGKSVTMKSSNVVSQMEINKAPSSPSNSTNTSKSITTTTTNNKPSLSAITSNNKSQTVYITKTGMKYHHNGCSSLSKSKIAINLEDAEKQGYEPCSKCCK